MKKVLILALLTNLILNFPVGAEELSKHKVLKVIDGDTIYIDFNNNGIPEKDEKVRLNGIDTFETKVSPFLEWQMKDYNLTQEEALGLGYLGKEFAKKNLLNKYVVAKYTADRKRCDMGRHLMSIYYDDGKNYEQEILKAELAVIYQKSNLADDLRPYENIEKVMKNTKKTHNFDLVFLNNKNGKYHDINCKYGQMLSDVELIKKPKSKKISPSTCCHNIKEKPVRVPIKRPLIVKNDLNIYFVNPTVNKYPQNECKNKECKGFRI